MDILAELRKLLKMAENNDPDDATANGLGEAEHIDATPAEPVTDPAPETETPQGGDGTPDAETAQPDAPSLDGGTEEAPAGAGVTDAGQEDADANGETLPQSEVSESELRDSLNRLATENETLRNRIAELAGDAALDAVDPTAALLAETEPDPAEYDEDAAQADVDEQLASIAALRG